MKSLSSILGPLYCEILEEFDSISNIKKHFFPLCGASRLCSAICFAYFHFFSQTGLTERTTNGQAGRTSLKKYSAIMCVWVWAPNTLFSRTCAWFFHAVAAYSACVTSLGLKQQLVSSTTAWVGIGTLQYIYVSVIVCVRACVCVSCEGSSCLCEYMTEGSKMV